jgi:D-alanyl-D-alanine carboxypeptidase (penicillin-binding protein 5/6)
MKKYISIALVSLLAFMNIVTVPNFAAIDPAALSSQGATLIDADTGQVLFSKNSDTQFFPASTTKALTALIIAEDLKLDEVVTIDKDSPFTTGSRIYVIEGEKFTVEQLLYALLLESANDAAVALAKYHSGTVEQFVKKMNEKAKSLGATHTNFTNPNGLPDTAHLTTAHDLALIGKAFEKQPKLMEMARTYKFDLPPTNKQPEVRHLFNSNRFLYGTGSKNKITYKGQSIDIKWDAITGLKTGYTNAAQQCFIGSATQNGRNLISVILKGQGNGLYTDTRTLLEHGFNDFKPFLFAGKGQLIESVPITDTKKTVIDLYTSADVKALIPALADEKTVTHEVIVNPDIKLPITEGQVLGHLKISYQGQLLTESDLVSLTAITGKDTLGKATTTYINWIPIDQSPKGLIILSIRIISALVVWRMIMGLLGGKQKKKKKLKKIQPAQIKTHNPNRTQTTQQMRNPNNIQYQSQYHNHNQSQNQNQNYNQSQNQRPMRRERPLEQPQTTTLNRQKSR